jgi:hypothetical protein
MFQILKTILISYFGQVMVYKHVEFKVKISSLERYEKKLYG